MPCNCDHMEPNQWEAESKKVASILCYLLPKLGFDIHAYIVLAAQNTYGNRDRVHDLTKYLCQTLEGMSQSEMDDLVYDGRSSQARRAAAWWESHQKADKEKAKQVELKKGYDAVRAGALAKLTDAEREVLGV